MTSGSRSIGARNDADDARDADGDVVAAVQGGTAVLRRDPFRRRAWTVLVEDIPQSHVDLDDPEAIEFEYVRRLALVADLVAPEGAPLDVLHLGGAGMTLARYVAVTRPRSRQRVIEIDAPLTDLVRRQLPLPARARVRVSARDARDALATSDRFDLVCCDVFAGSRTPAHLTTVEFLTAVRGVLRAGGTYAANVADGAPLHFARGQVATARASFRNVCLLAEPAVLRGRRFGNLVLVASDAPLPQAGLTRGCARDPVPGRVLAGPDLTRWVGQARPGTDADAQPSPAPPASLFERRR